MCPLATAQSSERTLTHAGRSMRHPGLPGFEFASGHGDKSSEVGCSANFCENGLSPSNKYLSCGPSSGIVNLLKGRISINHVGDEYEISVLSITVAGVSATRRVRANTSLAGELPGGMRRWPGRWLPRKLDASASNAGSSSFRRSVTLLTALRSLRILTCGYSSTAYVSGSTRVKTPPGRSWPRNVTPRLCEDV